MKDKNKKEVEMSIRYLIAEGFVRVEYDEDHPNDLSHARLFHKTQEEIEAEILAICQE